MFGTNAHIKSFCNGIGRWDTYICTMKNATVFGDAQYSMAKYSSIPKAVTPCGFMGLSAPWLRKLAPCATLWPYHPLLPLGASGARLSTDPSASAGNSYDTPLKICVFASPNFLKPKPYKTVILLGFCRNMAGGPQSQPKKSLKITTKITNHKKNGIFFIKK